MDQKWFISKNDGKSLGPYTFAQLQDQTRSGVLLPQHLVFEQGTAAWHEASRIAGLFSPNAPPPAPPGRRRGGGYTLLGVGLLFAGFVLVLFGCSGVYSAAVMSTFANTDLGPVHSMNLVHERNFRLILNLALFVLGGSLVIVVLMYRPTERD